MSTEKLLQGRIITFCFPLLDLSKVHPPKFGLLSKEVLVRTQKLLFPPLLLNRGFVSRLYKTISLQENAVGYLGHMVSTWWCLCRPSLNDQRTVRRGTYTEDLGTWRPGQSLPQQKGEATCGEKVAECGELSASLWGTAVWI